jgi:DNA-binding beta-propeller fold protein YncE
LGTLKVIRRIQPADVQPRGIAVTFDGKYLITANKNTSDIAVFSLPRLRLVKRIHIGHSPEFIKVDSAGDRLFATFEPGSSGGPPGAPGAKDEADEQNAPSQIVSFRIGDWSPGPVATAGSETEGLEFSPDGKYLLVANEAQDNMGIFAADTGVLIRNVDLKPYGIRPRAIKVSPLRNEYSVTMEASGTLLKMDMNFNVLKSVPTAAKPNGESFDRAGKRIFVAAALAGKLQVFDADSLNLLAEVPVGHRRLQSTVGSHRSLSSLHPTCTRFYGRFTICLTCRKAGAIYFGLASPSIIPGPNVDSVISSWIGWVPCHSFRLGI